jgi:PST family polysaccharide transporter
VSTLEPPKPGQIRRGMGWATVGQVGAEGLRIVTGFALARFMTPEEFGLVGMVTVIANYASVLLNFGFGSALVQRRQTSTADLSTVFWFNVLVGVLLTGLFAVASPALAAFYGRPELELISAVLALNFLLLAPSIVQRTMLHRELRFRGLAVVDLVATVVSSVLALGMGVTGWGTWSLVAWTLSRSAVQTVGSVALYRWIPALTFSRASVREMFGFAANVTASETLGYVAANVDRLLVGKFLGAGALGIYEQAVRLMMLPVANTSMVLGRVLFPALARMQDEPDRARGVYLKSVRMSMFVASPFLVGLLVAAEPFVAVAYGPGWDDLVPVLRLTALTGLASTLMTLATSVFRSTGQANLELRVGSVRRILGVAFACVGVMWNVVAVALGRLLAVLVGVVLYQRVIGRMLGVSLRAQVLNVSTVVVASFALAGSVLLVEHVCVGFSAPVVLFADVLVGACVYLGVARLARDRSLSELRAMAAAGLGRRPELT